jgi:enoyl-CoA hydratase
MPVANKSSSAGRVELDLRGSTALITLARPEKLNALSLHMKAELRRILDELRTNSEVRAVILTGEGERAFCAGTDIADMAELTPEQAKEFANEGQQLGARFEELHAPVIAAINGLAAGGGTELALGCHLRIASTKAQFSLPEIKLGIIPGYGGTQRLMRVVGESCALEMMLTGGSISAAEAEHLRLVNRVTEPADLINEAMSLADRIAEFSPLVVRSCLQAVMKGRELPLTAGLALERDIFSSLFASRDTREGIEAFLEKRRPVFRGI